MIRILIALDGSSAAETAISHAIAIARTFSAQIELFRVVSEPPADSATPLDCVDWQLRRRQAEIYLSRIAESLQRKKLRVSWQLREGDAAQEIIQRITEAETDLLVMTRYGKGNAQQFDSGGTVHKVLSASLASILLIDPMNHIDESSGYEQILVTVDDTQRSEWAAGFAAMVAKANAGTLHLLRIVEEPKLPQGIALTSESGRYLTQATHTSRTHAIRHLQNLSSRIDPGIKVTSSLLGSDNIPAAIEDVANEIDADLLVIASPGAPLWNAKHYGLVCETLLSHAERPVLVLHSQASEQSSDHYRSVFLDDSQKRADAS